MDDFIRYENINEDIERISNHLQLPTSIRELGHYVQSKRRTTDDFMSFYNDKTEQIVRDTFKEYFDHFGY